MYCLNPYLKKLLGIMLLGCVLAAGHASAEPGVSSDSIQLGQSLALSGPLGDLGQEVLRGSKVYFDALNARGGVNGRRINLVSLDDSYEVEKSVANVEGLIAGDATFALFGTFGTPNNEALIPIARKAGLPVLAPYSGASSIRSKSIKGVFNVRASYADELERLFDHLGTVGVKKIAVAFQNNTFGKEALATIKSVTERRKMHMLISVPVEDNSIDAVLAAGKLVDSQPEAVVLALAGKPGVEVIKGVIQRRRGLAVYGLSVLATPANLKAMGADGAGVTITQVVPYPMNAALGLVREYQQAMKAAGFNEFTHMSLEGYINAKVVAEGLSRAARPLTRAGLVAAMEGMSNHNLGGLPISFGNGSNSGLNYVELTMVNSQGKLIK